MGIGRAAVIAVLSLMVVAGTGREIHAQTHHPVPLNVTGNVAQEPAEHGNEEPGSLAGGSRTSITKWPRVRVTDPLAAHAARRALDRAGALLDEPACAAVLSDFQGREGRALSKRVDALGVDARTYLGLIVFIDGTRDLPCSDGAIGFTVPGSRVVRLCATELTRMSQLRPEYVAGALIHEMLHTLGLGENPPASHEITRRVLDRCSTR